MMTIENLKDCLKKEIEETKDILISYKSISEYNEAHQDLKNLEAVILYIESKEHLY